MSLSTDWFMSHDVPYFGFPYHPFLLLVVYSSQDPNILSNAFNKNTHPHIKNIISLRYLVSSKGYYVIPNFWLPKNSVNRCEPVQTLAQEQKSLFFS